MTIMNILKKASPIPQGQSTLYERLAQTHRRRRLDCFFKSFRIGVIINKEALKRRSVETLCHLSCSFSQVHSNLRRKKVLLSSADKTGYHSFL